MQQLFAKHQPKPQPKTFFPWFWHYENYDHAM